MLCEKTGLYTLKDRKPNFDNNPKCRLINRAKSEVEKIRKVLLDKINNVVRYKTNPNQWRGWFQNLDAQRNTKFKFDTVNFYP